MKKIKISVITVCYNAEKTILKTIKSIAEQTYENIEHIIKDGVSIDDTYRILKEEHKNYSYTLYSEKDKGIYDAMNVATKYANGEYIIFVNSGDVFVDKYVVENAVNAIIEGKQPDIFYGNAIYIDNSGDKICRKHSSFCKNKIFYLTGETICHQALFAKKECLCQNLFNLDYKICADREWIIRMVKQKKVFRYISLDICICEMDGFSLRNQSLYEQEVKECINQHYLLGSRLYTLVYIMKKNRTLYRLMSYVEKKILMGKREDSR